MILFPIDNLNNTINWRVDFIFYTRRMFAVENWSKYYPEAHYTFSYSYRNFAPNKKGNPLFLNGRLNIEYKLYETLNLY